MWSNWNYLFHGGLVNLIKVPIVVVATNEEQLLKEWFQNVQGLERRGVEPIPCVVDNGSWDDTPGVIWDAIGQGLIARENVFWMPANRGFASAQNHAIRHLGAHNEYRYLATLNIDARADSQWLALLVEASEASGSDSKRTGMWGGCILQPDPRSDYISSAGHSLRSSDGAFLDIDWDKPLSDELFSNRSDFEPFCPCFAAALWSFEMIKRTGLPDNDQFLYYDDVELAYKARILGWSAKFVKEALAYHPRPNLKKTLDKQRELQTRGRLLTVVRYFPDYEREAIVLRLPSYQRKILETVETRNKGAFRTDAERRKVYEEWLNRFPQRKRKEKNTT